jgi:ATP-dependent RNA helicase SUPV3L1/SUV3
MGQEKKIADGKETQNPKPTPGLITTLDDMDLRVIKRGMRRLAPPIESARILPNNALIQRFAAYFPPLTPFSYILRRLHEIALTHPRFELCELKDQAAVADVIQDITGLSIPERIALCASPCDPRDPDLHQAIVAFAKCIASNSGGALLDIEGVNLDILDYDGPQTSAHLMRCQATHRVIVLYLWLSYRFPSVFTSQALAFHVKTILEERIDNLLALSSFTVRMKVMERRRAKALSGLLKKEEDVEEAEVEEDLASVDPSELKNLEDQFRKEAIDPSQEQQTTTKDVIPEIDKSSLSQQSTMLSSLLTYLVKTNKHGESPDQPNKESTDSKPARS